MSLFGNIIRAQRRGPKGSIKRTERRNKGEMPRRVIILVAATAEGIMARSDQPGHDHIQL